MTVEVPPPFSHPVETEFARILDFYGIPWEYEPRTFVLEHDAAGNVTEAFAPDFYLPDQDLYVELTTMQPRQIRQRTESCAACGSSIRKSTSSFSSAATCAHSCSSSELPTIPT
jgi:hypothetical protein